MSIFGNIMSAIFGPSTPGGASPIATGGSVAAAPTSAPASGASSPTSQIDVEDVLTKMASKNAEKLDWRRSIVDLMKLLDLDSGLAARKQLAQELHYSGDTNDSASMNVWLHKQVMQKLAENGGKVPSEPKT